MATEAELAIRMTADARDVTSAMDDAGAAAGRMAADVDTASAKVDDAGSRMASAADGVDELGSKSSQAAGGLGDLGGAIAGIPGPIGAMGAGMEAAAPLVMGLTGASDLLNLALSSNIVVTAKARAAAVRDVPDGHPCVRVRRVGRHVPCSLGLPALSPASHNRHGTPVQVERRR